jgi:hypothetical protein
MDWQNSQNVHSILPLLLGVVTVAIRALEACLLKRRLLQLGKSDPMWSNAAHSRLRGGYDTPQPTIVVSEKLGSLLDIGLGRCWRLPSLRDILPFVNNDVIPTNANDIFEM